MISDYIVFGILAIAPMIFSIFLKAGPLIMMLRILSYIGIGHIILMAIARAASPDDNALGLEIWLVPITYFAVGSDLFINQRDTLFRQFIEG